MVSGEAEKSGMDLSPAVVDLVKKLAATKLGPTKLAGAMLDSKNPLDVKVHTASAITRLEEQRKEDIEYTSAAVNDVAYTSYAGRRKQRYDMQRMNIILEFIIERLPPSDKEDVSFSFSFCLPLFPGTAAIFKFSKSTCFVQYLTFNIYSLPSS